MSISEPMTEPTTTADDVDVPEIRFKGGLPGFPHHERFALVQWGDEGSPFSLLRSLDVEDLSFVVCPPALFFPDYAPVIHDDMAEALGITAADDAMVLTIVTVRRPVTESTANLLGPLIVNVHDLVGAQAILDPERYSSAAPLAATN